MKDSKWKLIENGINVLAYKMVKKSLQSTCIWAVYQPELPEKIKKIVK